MRFSFAAIILLSVGNFLVFAEPTEEIDMMLNQASKFFKLENFEEASSPYYSTSRLWDDGIIDPLETRNMIAMGIAMSLIKKFPEPRTGIYRM